jgi:hypothetical protein
MNDFHDTPWPPAELNSDARSPVDPPGEPCTLNAAGEDAAPVETRTPTAGDEGATAEPALVGEADTRVGPSRFVEAGRKGARRIHQLIQEGRVYEKEHGLKRGRQRLRQLIAQGKLYEEEHGLQPRRQGRRRQSSDAQLRDFIQALLPVMKPRLRGRLVRLLQDLAPNGQRTLKSC